MGYRSICCKSGRGECFWLHQTHGCGVCFFLLQKGVHLASIFALLRESCDPKGRINLPGAPMSSPFPYARGARQGSVEWLDMWNQVLDYALRGNMRKLVSKWQ